MDGQDEPPAAATQWEYRVSVVKLNPVGGVHATALQEKLDKAGRAGWQCAGVIGPDRQGVFRVIFQRPRRPGSG
ncbi:hypothetical protein [Actinomadura sp.]|jgi:hypothetical protein|uniref:hypothetical protein n=1 Tax=Actinomadura sp. TaxID=1989 RepID=UPI003360ABD3